MADIRLFGAASNIVRFTLKDKTTGQGKTGLTTATTGLVISTTCDSETGGTAYSGANLQTIATIGTFAAPTAGKCRFGEVDATNHKGLYEFQFLDARFAIAGAKRMVVSVNDGESTILDADYEIQFGPVDAVRFGTLQSGSNLNNAKLDSGASSTTDIYKGLRIRILAGTGAGQSRQITGYNGSSKMAQVDRQFTTAPDNTSTFALIDDNGAALNTSLQPSIGQMVVPIRTGTAQAGSGANTIKLDSGAAATNEIYDNDLITLTGGTGAGQVATIIAYNGATKFATVDRTWVTNPDGTTTFAIYASTTDTQFSTQGVAVAANATTITLAANASAVDNIYNGSFVTILSGTDSGDTQIITAYNGTTKVATVASWAVTPDTTSAYAVIPTKSAVGSSGGSAPTLDQILAGVFYTAFTESYAALHASPTLCQALMGIQQNILERSTSGTGVTIKKVDGSTTAMTATLNSAVTPTSITRTT